MKHLFTYIFACLFGGLFFSSCQQEDKAEPAEEQAGLYLSIGALGNNGSTRATSVTSEVQFKKFTVLYFRKLGSNYYLMDREDLEANPAVNNGEGNHRLSRPFTKWMGGPGNKASETYTNMKVVVIANLLPADITTALGTSLTYPITVVDDAQATPGTVPTYTAGIHDVHEMETVLKKLTFGAGNKTVGAIFKGGKKGDGTDGTGASNDYIPMYVCSEDDISIPTTYNANTYIGGRNYNNSAVTDIADRSYQLMRSVAKVSITNKNVTDKSKLPTSASGIELKTFQIYEAYIELGNGLGYVYHSAPIKEGTDAQNKKIGRVLASSVPTTDGTRNKGSEAVENTSSVIYAGNEITVPAVNTNDQTATYDQQVFTPFYLYEVETEAPTNPSDLDTYPKFNRVKHCHIVLKGWRDGDGVDDPATPGDETDLTKLKTYLIPFPYLGEVAIPSANFELTGSVLRNHHYNFTINGVTDLGLYMSLSVRPWTNVIETVDPIPVPD